MWRPVTPSESSEEIPPAASPPCAPLPQRVPDHACPSSCASGGDGRSTGAVWILNSPNPKHGSIAKRQAEVGIGVTIANILDHGAQQFGIIGDLAFDILTQQVTKDPAEILMPGIGQKERESVTMPTKRESNPRLESAFICHSMPSF